MVELGDGRPDGSGVPTIAELLLAYRDRTGASYREMARKVGDELTQARLHQLAHRPPLEFPKNGRTFVLLSELLEVPVATIVLAFAAGIGLDVRPGSGLMSQALPPGVDELPGEDRDTVVAVARALLRARAESSQPAGTDSESRASTAPDPDPDRQHDYDLAARRGVSQGRLLREQQDADAESQ